MIKSLLAGCTVDIRDGNKFVYKVLIGKPEERNH
jgi:hypothetical protein